MSHGNYRRIVDKLDEICEQDTDSSAGNLGFTLSKRLMDLTDELGPDFQMNQRGNLEYNDGTHVFEFKLIGIDGKKPESVRGVPQLWNLDD